MFGLDLHAVVMMLVPMVGWLVYVVVRLAAQIDEMKVRLDYACLHASRFAARAEAEKSAHLGPPDLNPLSR